MKPYAESCDQNKHPILAVLENELADCRQVLEIGSGTGQHAVWFARHLPHLTWLPSDLPAAQAGIRAWRDEAGLPNLEPPCVLDVCSVDWPVTGVDTIFSANTLHIMHWDDIVGMFSGIRRVLLPGGRLCIYGPFNYHGSYTSDSNARFDAWLKARDPDSGIRNFEDIDALAREAGLLLDRDHTMPENNRLLSWRHT